MSSPGAEAEQVDEKIYLNIKVCNLLKIKNKKINHIETKHENDHIGRIHSDHTLTFPLTFDHASLEERGKRSELTG